MVRLIKILLVVVVLVFAITEGWPRLKRQLEGRTRRPISSLQAIDASSGDEGECLRLANNAADAFGEGLRSYITPPFDVGQWERFADSVNQAASDADYLCSCGHSSCRLAREAMGELQSLISEMNGMVRSNQSMANPAARHARVYDLLNEGRAALSAG